MDKFLMDNLGSIVTVLTHCQYCYDLNGKITGVEGIYHDATDQINAEDALKKSEALLRSIFDASPAGIALTVDRVFMMVNSALCRITGYPEEELIGKPTSMVYFSEEDYIQTGKEYKELEKNRIVMTEARLKNKNGDEIFVLLSLNRINSADLKSGIITTVLDISRIKKAEQIIIKNEELLKGLFDASPVGIALVINRRLIKVNNTYCLMTGYSEEELNNSSTRMLYFDDDEYNRVGLTYNKIISLGRGMIEIRHRKKDGSELFGLLCLSLLNHDDPESGMVATLFDITEKKLAEKELRANQGLLQSIFEASPTGIVMLVNHAFTKVNTAMCQITGYSEKELYGNSTRILYFDDDEYNRVEKIYNQVKNFGRVITEALFRKKDGSAKNVLISFNALDRNDYSAGIVGTLLDITELKKMEHEKQKLEEMLLHSQKLESMGRLAGGIAHDFNNMLTAILGNAELAREYISESSNAYQKLEIIQNAANSAANLTKQLLAFSRKQVIEPKILNVNDVIKNVQKMIVTLLGENIILSIISDDNLNKITADPGQIEQIILNLSVNARDAMPDGGKLIIETKNTYLDEEYSKSHLNISPGSFVMLAISDTGIGMSKDVINHCFEPFYSTKEKGKGTGLGLSTVYGIVNQSGGTIEVYSEKGNGTVFKLYFPVVQNYDNRKESKPENTGVIKGNETILIAEDNEHVLKFCSDVLIKAGYKVMSAATGEKAFNVARNYKEDINLLITDVILPGINGKESSKKIKSIHKETKTLYNSGYTAEVIDKQGILDNGINFISKPYTATQLLLKVREILDSK